MQFDRLQMEQWLRAHRFKINPFEGNAQYAERDPLFREMGLPSFVHPSIYDNLTSGQLTTFIVANWGGGKSSLRYGIKDQFERDSLFGNMDRIVIDYSGNGLFPETGYASQVRAIAEQVVITAQQHGLEFAINAVQYTSDKQILDGLVKQCAVNNIRELWVLVDLPLAPDLPIVKESLTNLDSLLTLAAICRTNPTIRFLVFVPKELEDSLKLLSFSFPILRIEWQREHLAKLLKFRLSEYSKVGRLSTLARLFEPSCSNFIDDEIITFGLRWQSPRTMWLLGDSILQQHFIHGPREVGDLITYQTKQLVIEKVENELKQQEEQWKQITEWVCSSDRVNYSEIYVAIGEYKRGRPISLISFLKKRLNLSELNDLSLMLGIEYQDISGDNLSDKVREFVSYLDRHGRLKDLADVWPNFRKMDQG